ncbi:MAG TPA: hypothetical protein VFF93_08620 [Luteimonas sp.]|jgi:hypothetical protein|nr:hypothetical protein [Luteimonas sp.]
MSRWIRTLPSLLLFSGVLLLCACGHKSAGTDTADADATGTSADVALPKPEATGHAVTGMPATPGPRPVGSALVAPAESTTATEADAVAGDVAVDAGNAAVGDSGTAPDAAGVPAATAEPGVQDAVAVIRDYYAAIEQHDYAHAWSLWSDGGRSSGQTAQQFADGFASTAHVVVQPGAPGRLDAAAGSRYIEVPVTVEAAQRDGSVRRYAGSYTLRRAVVDGATAEQRAWRIASANLHEQAQ